MKRAFSWFEISAAGALGLAVIALTASLSTLRSQPKIVSVSVKTLIEEERDWLLAQSASEDNAALWIDTVAGEIETSLQTLESEGYIILVKEAVLAGDIPDLTGTLRDRLGTRTRILDPVSRSTGSPAAVSDTSASETAAPSYGDALLLEIEKTR